MPHDKARLMERESYKRRGLMVAAPEFVPAKLGVTRDAAVPRKRFGRRNRADEAIGGRKV